VQGSGRGLYGGICLEGLKRSRKAC